MSDHRLINWIEILTLQIIILGTSAAAGEIIVRIAPDGRDDLPLEPKNSIVGPLMTFSRIQELLDYWSRSGAAPDLVRIEIAPGTYHLDRALEINGARIPHTRFEIRGAGANSTSLLGSIEVGSDQDRTWSVQIQSELLDRYLEGIHASFIPPSPPALLIWDTDGLIVPGRWPRAGWGYISAATRFGDVWRIRLEDDNKQPSSLATGRIRLSGYPGQDWAHQSMPARVLENGEIEIAARLLPYGVARDQRMVAEAASGPSVDNRVSVDGGTATLVGRGGPFSIAMTNNFLKITDGKNVALRDLTIEGFSGDAIQIIRSEDVDVTGVRFQRIGNRGIFADSSRRLHLSGNKMTFIGEGGIEANGGNRISLERADIDISNNTFSRFSEFVRTYRPAAKISGVGISVLSNKIFDAPHSAIIFEGNSHLIDGNNISGVVTESRDSGAIYTWRDWTTYGTVISNNLIYDINNANLKPNGKLSDTNSVKGIYLDDFSSGISIIDNVFINVVSGILVNGGNDVSVTDNIFVNCRSSFSILDWGVYARRRGLLKAGYRAFDILEQLKRDKSLIFSLYPRLHDPIDILATPKGNRFANNILINSGAPDVLRGLPVDIDLTNPGGKTLKDITLPPPGSGGFSRVAIRSAIAAAEKAIPAPR